MRILPPALAAAFAAACGLTGGAPPVISVLPEFEMSAVGPATETPFGRRDLLGKVWIADFVYTRCAGPCPLLTRRLSALSRRLPAGVGLLTVTVDPDGDSAQRLRAYAAAYGADARRWVFLRGSPADTYRLLYAGFRLPVSTDPRAPAGARVLHSTRLALIDRAGAVRGFYDGLSDADASAAAGDARRLLEADS